MVQLLGLKWHNSYMYMLVKCHWSTCFHLVEATCLPYYWGTLAQGYNAAKVICVVHSPPFFLSLLRGLHPVMATSASGYNLIRIW